MPALRRFTVWARSDDAAVKTLLQVFKQETLNFSSIWDRYLNEGGVTSGQPKFVWYINGLLQARGRYQNMLEQYPTSGKAEENPLPYHTRVTLRNLKFVDLWDCLWREASNICMAGRVTHPRVGPPLCDAVLRLAMRSQLSPSKKQGNFTLLVLQDRRSSWLANPLFSDAAEYLPQSSRLAIDLSKLESALDESKREDTWGRRFYDVNEIASTHTTRFRAPGSTSHTVKRKAKELAPTPSDEYDVPTTKYLIHRGLTEHLIHTGLTKHTDADEESDDDSDEDLRA
jgi:hypothetical protein